MLAPKHHVSGVYKTNEVGEGEEDKEKEDEVILIEAEAREKAIEEEDT